MEIHTETTSKPATEIKDGDVLEIGEINMRVSDVNPTWADNGVVMDLVPTDGPDSDRVMGMLVLDVKMTVAVLK